MRARPYRPYPRRAAILARRTPFTLGLLVLLLTCGAATGSLWHPVAASALLARVGYGPPAVRAGRTWTLVTGIPFTLYPWMILTIAFIVALFVGVYEYRMGTTCATLVFLTTQIGGAYLAAVAVIGPLASGRPAARGRLGGAT